MNSQEKERIARIALLLNEMLSNSVEASVFEKEQSTDDLVAMAKDGIRARRRRQELFPNIQVADPAWDLMLELFINQAEGRRISVTGLGLGANVPGATVLRWLAMFHESGLIVREPDPGDRRRIWVSLTPDGFEKIAQGIAPAKASPADQPRVGFVTGKGTSPLAA
jgi:Transcriptional regulators